MLDKMLWLQMFFDLRTDVEHLIKGVRLLVVDPTQSLGKEDEIICLRTADISLCETFELVNWVGI